MAIAVNPVLPGFHPDPSLVRVGNVFYLATSTFEWWPGVRIYESHDLVHFRLCATPLDRVSQLNMHGCKASDGVWAPCLSHDGERFYLVYTNVQNRANIWDSPNYLVWADSIEGPWSEPVYLHSLGFDPSLFHDSDGRKWLVSVLSDHRPGRDRFAGIALQEYDPAAQALTGPVHTIFTPRSELAEGPHLLRHGQYYYLLLACGGTGLRHSALLARSASLTGPYQPDPAGPFLTTREDAFFPLQKAGHASLAQSPQGRWFIAHLCARPLPALGRSMLGRETAVSEVCWTDDGWLRLANGSILPDTTLDTGLDPHPYPPDLDDLAMNPIPRSFQSLREPLPASACSLTARPGWLRLYGGQSLFSRYEQTLLARRAQHFWMDAEALLEFSPEHAKHMAGLVCYYDNANFYYLHKTLDEAAGECVCAIGCINGRQFAIGTPQSVPAGRLLFLRAQIQSDRLQFYYSTDGRQYAKIGEEQDASTLSDEASREGRFTGAMIGVCCQDLWQGKHPADFLSFRYSGATPGGASHRPSP